MSDQETHETHELERRVRKHVRAVRGFYTHAAVFVVVILLLAVLDAATPGDGQLHLVILAWGVGLAIHWAVVFRRLPWLTREWEDEKVREILDRKGDD